MSGNKIEDHLSFVRSKITENKKFFKEKSKTAKIQNSFVQCLMIALGALTTVLLGWKVLGADDATSTTLSNAALASSVALTALTSIEAIFHFKWSYVKYTMCLTKLYEIEDRLENEVKKGEIDHSKIDEYFDLMQEMLKESNVEWQKKLTQKDVKKGGG